MLPNYRIYFLELNNNERHLVIISPSIYFDSLEHFETAETLGTRIGDNKKAIYDNCEIRYKEHCDIVFADLRGGVKVLGTFSSENKDEDDEWDVDEDDDNWDDMESDDDLFGDEDDGATGEGESTSSDGDDDWEVDDEDWAD